MLASLGEGDPEDQREAGDLLMAALRRDEVRLDTVEGVYGAPVRVEPLTEEETRQARELLRSWLAGEDQVESQGVDDEDIERVLREHPIRFREVDLDP